ncbi:hypothetical protein GCM10027614_35630 [Micromonospora vulcania]
MHDVGALDRCDQDISDRLGEHGVLTVREAARDRHHELGYQEQLRALSTIPGRVGRIAAGDHTYGVPTRDEGGGESHRRYRGAVVVDVERVDDQRDDHCRPAAPRVLSHRGLIGRGPSDLPPPRREGRTGIPRTLTQEAALAAELDRQNAERSYVGARRSAKRARTTPS